MKGVITMKKPENSFLKRFRYLCLVSVIALGLLTIVENISAGGGARHAGPGKDCTGEGFPLLADADQTAKLNQSGNGKIELAAVNYGLDGIDLWLGHAIHYDTDHKNDTLLGYDAGERIGKGKNISYESNLTVDSVYNWARHNTPVLFKGNGERYLVDFCGKNLVVFSFNSTEVTPLMSGNDLKDRIGNAHNRTFLLKASNPPWWLITSRYIHGHGEPTGTPVDIPAFNCAGENDPGFSTADLSADYSLDNPKSGS